MAKMPAGGRKTKCHSKQKSAIINAVEFIQFHWNFMDPLPNGVTPAMIESRSDQLWRWAACLMYHYAL